MFYGDSILQGLPNINVSLVLQEEEGTLTVLSLDGHVQQCLSVGHSVVDRGPRAQQLSRYGVHPWQRHVERDGQYKRNDQQMNIKE